MPACFEVFLRWTSSGNRATNTPVILVTRTNRAVQRVVNQQANGSRLELPWPLRLRSETVLVTVTNSNSSAMSLLMPFSSRIPPLRWCPDDRDEDGFPDWWERWYFLSETSASPHADSDADGMSNLQEYLTGTDPLDPASRFAMRAVSTPPRPGVVVLAQRHQLHLPH